MLKLTQATSLVLSHPFVEALMAESVSTFFLAFPENLQISFEKFLREEKIKIST